MLPLTSSLYVSGEIADVANVMVDIGTGYYVEVGVGFGLTLQGSGGLHVMLSWRPNLPRCTMAHRCQSATPRTTANGA